MADHLPPGPWEYETTAPFDGHHGKGHVYIVDANGRKIASCWGKPDEKLALKDLIIEARGRAEEIGQFRVALERILHLHPNPQPPHDDRLCPPRDLEMALIARAALAAQEGNDGEEIERLQAVVTAAKEVFLMADLGVLVDVVADKNASESRQFKNLRASLDSAPPPPPSTIEKEKEPAR